MTQPRYQDDPFDEPNAFVTEKHVILDSIVPPQKPKRHVKGSILVFVVGMIIWLTIGHNVYHAREQSKSPQIKDMEGEFESIIPSEKLEWHLCGDWETLCARLTVPMDYNRPLNASRYNPKVHIALLMVPAAGINQGKFSVSPLIINPGGPGGSGTFFARYFAPYLRVITGDDQDVLGFDPRGVAATTPRADCFSDLLQSAEPDAEYGFGDVDYLNGFYKRLAWLTSGVSIGLVNSSAVALGQIDVRARTLGKLCKEKDSVHGDHSIFKHLQTPNVARDMLSIVDAWEEWRENGFQITDSSYNQLVSKVPEPRNQNSFPNTKPAEGRTDSEYSLETKGKLVYWGFSYGTLLGATFAAMFPDRVGRVVLDGVIDADYYVEPVWAKSITDTDPIYKSFSKYCYEGKENCSLYRPGDSYEDVKSRFEGAQTKLRENPISFIGPASHNPIIFTIENLRLVIFSALYAPNSMFPLLSLLIDSIISENYFILELLFPFVQKDAFCKAQPESLYPTDAQIAIMCGDKRYPLNETTTEIRHRFEEMSKFSSFADLWLSLMMGCDGWAIDRIDPPMRWGRHPAHSEKPINTSFPLLFLSNTYDPVTPLSAAVKMAKLFTDAGLLEQKAMGHCSISSVSACTMAVTSAYFKEGKVPRHPVGEMSGGDWEKCEADEWPFHPWEGGVGAEGEGRQEEMKLAVKGMQRLVTEHGLFQQEHNSGMLKSGELFMKLAARKGGK